MPSSDEVQRELQLLAERIRQLRSLQESQKHLAFVTNHLQDHIENLQRRIRQLRDEVA